MSTRVIVTGIYTNPSTYVLYEEDGSVYQEIKEGEPFRIDNQFRQWVPVRVPRRSGRGTLLVCRKFGDGGDVIEEFPLFHKKRGLWALTSGAARNGVFHNYREPASALEQALATLGVSSKIIERVTQIDRTFEIGGQLCRHVTRQWGYGLLTDGDVLAVTQPELVTEHSNQYHIGCECSGYDVRVTDASYAISYQIDTYANGNIYGHVAKVLITSPQGEEGAVKALRKFAAGDWSESFGIPSWLRT